MVEGKVRTVSVHSVVEVKVHTVSVHSVWWRARYVKLVYTQCGKGGGGVGGGGVGGNAAHQSFGLEQGYLLHHISTTTN